MATDQRKPFFLATAENYFGLTQGSLKNVEDHSALNNFLNAANCSLLIFTVSNEKDSTAVSLTNKIDNLHDQNALVFYKAKPEVIEEQNLHTHIRITTLPESPLSSLFYQINHVFAPLLLNDSSQSCDPQIQTLVSELQAGLGTAMRSKPSGTSQSSKSGLAAILSPSDEFKYWSDLSKSSGKAGAEASAFTNALKPLANDFSSLEGLTLPDLDELVDDVFNIVDDLWKLEGCLYPQPRMIHLFNIIGNSLVTYMQKTLSEVEIWQQVYSKVETDFNQAILVCNKWTEGCDRLSQLYWQHFPSHQWDASKPYVPVNVAVFKERIVQVLELRTVHKQLAQFLSPQEQNDLKLGEAFRHFEGFNPLFCNSYTEPRWIALNKQLEQILAPIELKIAGKLKNHLTQYNDNALQSLEEFLRYKDIIRRPQLAQEFMVQRETLLELLQTYVRQLKKEMSSKNFPEMLDVPEVVREIFWIRQTEAKLSSIRKAATLFFASMTKSSSLTSEVDDLLQDLKEQSKEAFDGWNRDLLANIRDKTLSLSTDVPVVSFDKSKLMKVNYNPRLVSLIREVRLLTVLGYSVAPQIIETSKLAQKFAQQAKALEQIVNFHNTVGDRIIASQKPLLLDAALALSNLVQEQSSVKWSQSSDVATYITKLQSAVERLSRDINRLSNYHRQIVDKVTLLFDADLIKQQHKWKDGLRDIRFIIGTVEAQGYKNLQAWKIHWDYQIYKALELQYQRSLEVIHENMPDIRLDLDYKQQKIVFRPTLEDIRRDYYAQLKRFVCIPLQFRGVQDSSSNSIFPSIVDRNARRFERVYTKAEMLFGKLEALEERHRPWVAIGQLDMDEYTLTHLKTSEDWERNFRLCKAKGQEIAKLATEDERLGCLVISLLPLRKEIENLNRRYWDTLISSLQSNVLTALDTLESFSSKGRQTLELRASSVDELSLVTAKHAELMQSLPEMTQLMADCEKKAATLSAWARDKPEALDKLKTEWDNFLNLLETHEQAIKRQMDTIKESLGTEMLNLANEAERFKLKWEQVKPKEIMLEEDASPQRVKQCLEVLRTKRDEWKSLMEQRERIQGDFTRFRMEAEELVLFAEVEEDLSRTEKNWLLLEEFTSGLETMGKEEWIIFRSKAFKLDEYLDTWSEKLAQRTQTTPIIVILLKEIEKYKSLTPTLKFVRGETFADKHWMEFYSLLNLPAMPIEKLTLGHLLQSRDFIINQSAAIKELNAKAAGEAVVRQALLELEQWDVDAKFVLYQHTDVNGGAVPLIKEYKEILSKVGENQNLIQSVKDSTYHQAFGDRITIWETRLADLDEYLRNMNQVQRKWLYLEPVFGRGALAKEMSRFKRLDLDFKSVMSDVARDVKVIAVTRIPNLRAILNGLLDQLARCQKSLSEFLEEKRSIFPRFYFLGDEDLLEILGQATKPSVVQTHLKKLFAGIHSVEFSSDDKRIEAVYSIEGEQVFLSKPVVVSAEVETWLSKLVEEMQTTLKQLLQQCYDERQKQNSLDPMKYPSQILCLTEAIVFGERCEKAITTGSLNKYLSELKNQLASYTGVALESGSAESNVLELKLQALILDAVHHMEIVEELLQGSCNSVNDWAWQKQLRFYLMNGTALAKMIDAQVPYSYEYQGNAPKLVHTPLTDKCYLTLTQGMQMGLGGNPYGPAGTGKTESVKALGGLLGRQVLVFNCDEGIDVKSMGRIFVGLAKCGAWGCFDEFNRLEEATLSAVSTLIQAIQSALKQSRSSTVLLGAEIPVHRNTGIFVTLNPAGKGYGGRQKLPDNLKQLFRPVVMSQPDVERIAEVLLYSEGFAEAKTWSRKLVEIFRLAEKLLSRQQHYDWGLRALKSVLKSAGRSMRTFRTGKESSQPVTSDEEADIVIQAVRFNTLSKLTLPDCLLFDGLVRDVFPNVVLREGSYAALVEAAKDVYASMGLIAHDRQIQKVLELHEQLNQRMGVVIVGPPGAGKSTIWNVLKQALVKMEKSIQIHTLNPKAVSRTQLLGSIDLDTREWTDGILTKCARVAIDQPQSITTWIVCDGDVDPEWIESLNSVLDDNRLLTMPSGERLQFGPNANFVFETHDLKSASPATISRMGVIFLSEEDLSVKCLIQAWLQQQTDDGKRVLTSLIEDYFYPVLEKAKLHGEFQVPISNVGLIQTALSHLGNVTSKKEFTAGLLYGFTTNLTEATKDNLAKEIYAIMQEDPPSSQRVYAVEYDPRRDMLTSIDSQSAEIELDESDNPIVLTADVQLALKTLQPWLEKDSKPPVLLVGPEGCGKGLILKHIFQQLRSTKVATLHCGAHTTPLHVLHKLSQVGLIIASPAGRILRPRECEKLILHLRDLNLVLPDIWGTAMLVTFLEQVLNYNGCYDSTGEWLAFEGIHIVISMVPSTGTGRYALSPRLTSLLHIHAMGHSDAQQLELVCKAYLDQAWKRDKGWSVTIGQTAAAMVQLYSQVRATFTVDQERHYVFTTRDLTSWAKHLPLYEFHSDTDHFIEVWSYEASRCFRDKLVNRNHRSKFDGLLQSVLASEFGHSSYPSIPSIDTFYVSMGNLKKVQWAKRSNSEWQEVLQKLLVQYGREQQPLHVALIPELLALTAKTDRLLSQSGGCVLMAGRAGVGRHVTIKLMATLYNARWLTLHPGKNYPKKQFSAELKSVMQVAGVDNERVLFVVEDYQITEPAFLAMINSLLSAGEVPGLYSPEELDSVTSSLRDQALQDSFRGSVMSYFASRVKANCHVILMMDFTNPNFVNLCEENPAIYKECGILWEEMWEESSLMAVAQNILNSRPDENGEEVEETNGEVLHPEALNQAIDIYLHAEEKLRNPARFVFFMKTYSEIQCKQRTDIDDRKRHLLSGVSKLTEAGAVVNQLKAQALEQEKILAEKQADAQSALQMITDTMANANVQRGEMQELREQTMRESVKVAERKKAIDAELAEIEPLLAQARSAVADIRPEALSEIRSLRAPPDTIRDILEGVLRLMGNLDTSWSSMKSFLAKRGIKEEIRGFDARKITPENRKAVEALLESRGESFDPRMAKRAFTAAAPLAAWVQANVRFSRVIERILPLEQEQNRLQKNLQRSEEQMGHLSNGLDSVDKQVAMLRDKLAESTREAAQVEIGLKKAAETLNAAQTLVKELEGEYQRWQEQLQGLDSGRQDLPKHALLAAAFITFLTEKDELIRQNTLKQWAKSLELDQFDIRTFLTSEQQLMQWRSEGLPSDTLSIENAVALVHVTSSKQKSVLRPYIIDPSLKAVEWLRNHVRKSPVEVINQQDEKFASTLEFAVRFGKILIVQDVETIEPMLIPVLKGDYQIQGTRRMVQLGEKLVDCNPDFQLFLCTRSPHVTLAPSIQALVAIINYNTTQAGLAGQILTVTLSRENPELERRKTELLSQEEKLKTELVRLEDLLLKQLADAEGNILENKELLTFLNSTKSSSATISQSLTESLVLQGNLDKQRQVYMPLAEFGSKLFFVVQELSAINPVYQISLPSFFKLYNQALDTKSGDNASERIAILQQALLTHVYQIVCRGTFRADRVTCALHVARGMFPAMFKEKEWEVFTGQLQANPKEVHLPEWLDETRAPSLAALKVHLPSLFNSLQLDNNSLWTVFTSSEREVPSAITRIISAFQQVLVVQALAPDRLLGTISHFAMKTLGINELSPTFSMKSLMEESSTTDPVLMLLPTEGGAGGDPAQQVLELSQETGQNYNEVAMGQGQEAIADQFLQEAASQGSWLCLKNVHLATHWLSTLERFLDSLQTGEGQKVNPQFRLWMTAEAQAKLPSTLLQRSIKITFEAPPGVKRNMQRSLDSWPKAWLSQSSQSPQKLQALLVLAWLHALLQERRFYIPQGWVKAYEFSDADLKAAANVLDRFWSPSSSEEKGPKWKYVQGLLGNAIYGGRIDNVFDLRTLQAYLVQYFDPKVFRDNATIDLAKNLSLPTAGNLQDYLTLIKRLPDEDQASYFGLPSNIERSVQRNMSETVILQMKMLGLVTTAQAKFDKETWNIRLGPILNLWKSLNQGSNLLQIKSGQTETAKGSKNVSPLEAFVEAESRKSLIIMQIVHKSLAALSKVLRGLMPLTPLAFQLGTTLMEHTTPASWVSWWEGPSDPAKYLQGLVQRAQNLHTLSSKKGSELLLQPLDLPSFISPEALLSVLRQQTARELGLALDRLELVASWSRELAVTVQVKASLTGITIEGAVFAHGNLQECSGETPNETSMPLCTVAWVPQEKVAVHTHQVSLPLYADRSRSKLVTALEVPVDNEDVGKWYKAGIALLVRE